MAGTPPAKALYEEGRLRLEAQRWRDAAMLLAAANRRVGGPRFHVTVQPELDFSASGDEAGDVARLTAAIQARIEGIRALKGGSPSRCEPRRPARCHPCSRRQNAALCAGSSASHVVRPT